MKAWPLSVIVHTLPAATVPESVITPLTIVPVPDVIAAVNAPRSCLMIATRASVPEPALIVSAARIPLSVLVAVGVDEVPVVLPTLIVSGPAPVLMFVTPETDWIVMTSAPEPLTTFVSVVWVPKMSRR